MNVVELMLQLGRWGQTHQTEVLTGVLATPLLLGGLSLARRGRQRGDHDARVGAVGHGAGSPPGRPPGPAWGGARAARGAPAGGRQRDA